MFLSRNIFFYKNLQFNDSYETRIYLMFFHYSVILIIFKERKIKPDQTDYDNLFFHIENNLRELGFGDVSVNKKMKDLNKIFYDILIKLNSNLSGFKLNKTLSVKYFDKLSDNDKNWDTFDQYFMEFYKFCFEIPTNNMIEVLQSYKYGSS